MKFVTIFDPKSEINFVRRFKIGGIIAICMIVVSLGGLFVLGMPWGIDFLGGVEIQAKFQQPVAAGDIRDVLESIQFDKNQVQQFGPSQNNELLIRVERAAALRDEDVKRLQSLIKATFPPNGKSAEQAEGNIYYDGKLAGNQVTIWLATPSDVDLSDPIAMKQSLEKQRLELVELLDSKSGIELRKTAQDKDSANPISSVVANDPQNGRVRYTAHLAGVTGKIHRELEKNFGDVEIRKVDFVDSQVSRQLRTDGLLAVIYAILAIFIYIAIRFDVYFSPGAVVALINDTLGAMMVFIFFRVEFDTPSIAAMLTIVGYSINNTIVVYDRIRETLPQNPKKPLSVEEITPYVNKAINDTLSRTINTTLTTLCASVAIWIFASGVIANFAMVLTAGIIVGAFSSVFVAPAIYLLAKKYIQPPSDGSSQASHGRLTREDRAKGVV